MPALPPTTMTLLVSKCIFGSLPGPPAGSDWTAVLRIDDAQRPRLSARGDRTGCDTDPGALALLICVRVQSFLVHSIGERGVCGAGVDQGNVTEDADVDVVHSEILEGTRLSDVVEELFTVPGDARSLHDEVFSEELAEALDIVELVGVNVVIVELLEDRQIFGGLLGVDQFLVPSLCASVFAAGGLSFRCRVRGVSSTTTIPPGSGRTETAAGRGELSSPQAPIHPGE